jgi:hypothetical protein
VRERSIGRARSVHPHAWIWEPFEEDPSFVLGAMFGTKVAYLDGRLMLCFAGKTEPWRGILVCTDRGEHPSLMTQFPVLKPHPILGKWLYLPESADEFEGVAVRLVGLARARDPRIGVAPGAGKRRRA